MLSWIHWFCLQIQCKENKLKCMNSRLWVRGKCNCHPHFPPCRMESFTAHHCWMESNAMNIHGSTGGSQGSCCFLVLLQGGSNGSQYQPIALLGGDVNRRGEEELSRDLFLFKFTLCSLPWRQLFVLPCDVQCRIQTHEVQNPVFSIVAEAAQDLLPRVGGSPGPAMPPV